MTWKNMENEYVEVSTQLAIVSELGFVSTVLQVAQVGILIILP